jgi:hypothetical protein
MGLTAQWATSLYASHFANFTRCPMSRRLTWISRASLAASILMFQVAHADMVKLTVREAVGQVTIEAGGHSQPAKVGMTFTPPAEVRAGTDGSILLADAETTLKISPNSIVAIPASAQPSGMIDRILQRSGSVLYNVNSRKGRPFSVETPLLTSVVKGTLFSVNSQGQSATVALLEGSLEVSGQGIDTPVLLEPGDAARRKTGERTIGVERHSATAGAAATSRHALRSNGAASDAQGTSRGMDWATQDLAQVTAAIGLAPPSAAAAPTASTPPPTASTPGSATPPPASTPPASTPDPTPPASGTPSTTPPTSSPPATTPPITTPPATTPPVTAPSTTPPATTPPVTTPPVVAPPASSPPVVTPPTGSNDDDDQGKGSRHGRGRGHEQGHGQGNDDRDAGDDKHHGK